MVELYKSVTELMKTARENKALQGNLGNIIDFQQIIDDTPTADVEEVRHGQWMPQIVNGVKAWDCSECKTLGSPHWKRCPVCEAKMDGGKAE